MKAKFFLVICLAAAGATGFANGFLALGGAGDLIFDDPAWFAPDIRLQAGVNLYAPLSDAWSTFFSASFFHFFRPVDAQFRYLYSADWNVSFRSGDLFFKTGLSAKGEQLFAPAYAWPDRFENVLQVHLACDIGEATVFLTPELCYNREDLVADNVLLRGEGGLTFPLGERAVATAKLKGRLTLVPLHYSITNGAVELGLSHYPDLPFFYTLTLGALLQSSDYEETAAGVNMKRLDYFQLSLNFEGTAALSDRLLLKICLPVKLSFKNMGAIRDGYFNGESEWTLALAPEAELSIALAGTQNLVIGLKAEPFFSNSDYYDLGYAECSLAYKLAW
jgi:hypothetical protein